MRLTVRNVDADADEDEDEMRTNQREAGEGRECNVARQVEHDVAATDLNVLADEEEDLLEDGREPLLGGEDGVESRGGGGDFTLGEERWKE